MSAAASRRHLDASLDLFARKSPRSWRDLAEKRALSAPRLFFFCGLVMCGWSLVGEVGVLKDGRQSEESVRIGLWDIALEM